MQTLLIALGVGLGFIIAYHTYGRWLGRRIFDVATDRICPSHALRDDRDFVPTPRFVVFGHHFTSIAATGPIVGPAIAVIWGWVPAVLWVLLGSIFMGAVHDFGALMLSLRSDGQTIGQIAGRVINKRVRLLFLLVLFLALTIIIAIFGLVIAAVFKQYPAAIFPCLVQIPIAVVLGIWLHRKGVNLMIPSLVALAIMYVTVFYGNEGMLGDINLWLASRSIAWWVIVLLVYSYVASVLPVWTLLQPRDYINALQLISALGLVVVGLIATGMFGGAPPVPGAPSPALEIVAPAFQPHPQGAPPLLPFLFITIACGAISGFHCLVSSGTSSKQLARESDAQFVSTGSMMTEGFLATLVILACVAGLGLGSSVKLTEPSPDANSPVPVELGKRAVIHSGPMPQDHLLHDNTHQLTARDRDYNLFSPGAALTEFHTVPTDQPRFHERAGLWVAAAPTSQTDSAASAFHGVLVGQAAWHTRYASWGQAGGLGQTVGAFVDGSANFLRTLGLPMTAAVALMGVFVASFAGTTLDSATRLQRYVIQEIASTWMPEKHATAADSPQDISVVKNSGGKSSGGVLAPIAAFIHNPYIATLLAVVIAGAMASIPLPGQSLTWASAGKGGLILWPMFGAMNQLLAGLAFMVIAFWLWRRGKPIFFLMIPLVFMLLMPAWAMIYQCFIADAGRPGWVHQENPNYALIFIALATLALEAWMIIEAILLWPRVKGILEQPASSRSEPPREMPAAP